MSKRTIVNLLLLAIVATLTVYVKKNPVQDNEITNFTQLAESEVNTIVIQRSDQTQIILEKIDSDWLITSPVEGKIHFEKLSLLLKILVLKSRHQHIITEPKQLIRYDLNNPKVSLFLNDEQFDFGNTNDFNKLRYILHDEVVHSVKDITYHLLIDKPESFLQP